MLKNFRQDYFVRKFIASFVILLATGSVNAAPVFDSGPPIGQANYATYRLMADDFQVSTPSIITGATLSVLGTRDFTLWDGTAEYFIFTDASGKPGTALAHGFGNHASVTAGTYPWLNYGSSKNLSFAFESPIQIQANTPYWLAMHLQADYNPDQYDNAMWMYASDQGNSVYAHLGDQPNWVNYYSGTLSFAIDGTASNVPLPGSGLIFLGGLLALGFANRSLGDTRGLKA